jgi:hypothetical protein
MLVYLFCYFWSDVFPGSQGVEAFMSWGEPTEPVPHTPLKLSQKHEFQLKSYNECMGICDTLSFVSLIFHQQMGHTWTHRGCGYSKSCMSWVEPCFRMSLLTVIGKKSMLINWFGMCTHTSMLGSKRHMGQRKCACLWGPWGGQRLCKEVRWELHFAGQP